MEPCNEWEMLSPSFIMQRSLLNARQLGPASSLRAPPPLHKPLLSSHRNLNQTAAGHEAKQRSHTQKHLLIAVVQGKHQVFIIAGSLQGLKDFETLSGYLRNTLFVCALVFSDCECALQENFPYMKSRHALLLRKCKAWKKQKILTHVSPLGRTCNGRLV